MTIGRAPRMASAPIQSMLSLTKNMLGCKADIMKQCRAWID